MDCEAVNTAWVKLIQLLQIPYLICEPNIAFKGLEAAATVLQLLFNDSPADLRFMRVKLLLIIRTLLSKVAWQTKQQLAIASYGSLSYFKSD